MKVAAAVAFLSNLRHLRTELMQGETMRLAVPDWPELYEAYAAAGHSSPAALEARAAVVSASRSVAHPVGVDVGVGVERGVWKVCTLAS